ncbi:MAG: polysaccharide biosynthesis/export family protein [Planctomycetes bacterium]|nr:polysaccharide biosynthesis/export family protein [Planctomycetota bacterium]
MWECVSPPLSNADPADGAVEHSDGFLAVAEGVEAMLLDKTRFGTHRCAALASAVVASLLLASLSGCFGKKRDAAVITPAPFPTDRELAEARRRKNAERYAPARAEYYVNRPAAPEKYQIFPTQPVDNRFGEFVDEHYTGIDAQPALPPLPADNAVNAPPPGPNRFAYDPYSGGMPPATPPLSQQPPPAYSAYGSGSAAPAVIAAQPQPRARFRAPRDPYAPDKSPPQPGAAFRPIEQLVYGGDYPDLDKPELYRLMPKDVITVTVKDHPEFSGTMELQPDGTVALPNSPEMPRLRGLTCDEAAQALSAALAIYIRGEPVVRVQANRARGGYYYVLGEVMQPGRFPMGMEPVKLSEAVLAANWEANPARRDLDGDELGPSFPAATPRGRFIAPNNADLARVMLITPHRSQPVRTTHDARSALMGLTGDDPVVRPGQIIVVPSLDPGRNAQFGIAPPEGLGRSAGFSTANSPARLPEVTPYARPVAGPVEVISVRESNMTDAFAVNQHVEAPHIDQPEEYCETWLDEREVVESEVRAARARTKVDNGWGLGF